jgi:hypothetical protein
LLSCLFEVYEAIFFKSFRLPSSAKWQTGVRGLFLSARRLLFFACVPPSLSKLLFFIELLHPLLMFCVSQVSSQSPPGEGRHANPRWSMLEIC